MASNRRYKFLCPIARALDAVGDRWELLILRDLHAGPARFKDIQTGLSGIATNLLTDRLVKLISIGLIEKSQNHLGVTVYALTPRGEQTRGLLLELSLFGALFPPEPDLKPIKNYRTVAVTLAALLEKAATESDDLRVQLNISDEPYCITVQGRQTKMKLGTCEAPEAVLSTNYEALVAAGDGELSPEQFAKKEVILVSGSPDVMQHFLMLLGRSIAYFGKREAGRSEA